MTIQQVVDLARNSELKNLAVKDDISAIVGYINLGMLELYKRFPLEVKEHMIELVEGTDIYTMPSDFMWMVAAYDEVPEDEFVNTISVPINEEDNPLSINTVSWNKVQVPVEVNGAYISVIYVAAPPVFMYDSETKIYSYVDSDGVTQSGADLGLPLPAQMTEPLLHFIGYRAHGAVSGEINGENRAHYMNFEASCNRIEQRGMFTSDDVNMDYRYENRIWV